jgi:hypothetical protein
MSPAMPARKIDFDSVLKIGLALPDVEKATHYGGPSLKIGKRLLACPAINKSAEPNSLVVRISNVERDRLIAAEPDTYYLTDHYRNHSCVLVRLDRIERDSLKQLLQNAWRHVEETL